MASVKPPPVGPDLARGVTLAEFVDGKLVGQFGNQEVLLIRTASAIVGIDAHCSHYHGPLVDGLLVGESIRCPWHHACFDLKTGEATRAPAFERLSCWRVEQRDGKIVVLGKHEQPKLTGRSGTDAPEKIVIVGGGAAGFAAAEMLRRQEFRGQIVMFSQESAAPIDRPNLSKDYLAGSAAEEWMPLKPVAFYRDVGIDLRLEREVIKIETGAGRVVTGGGETAAYDRLLIATGAEPVRLSIPGAEQPNVHTLRSLADSDAIIEAAAGARRAVVIGASFIGLEVAAALRTRNVEVHVVAPESCPMERTLGRQMGGFIRALHEEHGVVFHLEDTVVSIHGQQVTLRSGGIVNADLIVVGIGVRPRLALAAQAGLAMDRGVTVNGYLETSVPGIYAAGDIARWPDPYSADTIRVEHWVVAARQGQTAARNMLGQRRRFDAVPFFWSQHYDVPISYVGHAEQWDEIAVDGSINSKDCLLQYKRKGRVLAVATIYRDLDSLRSEFAMEQQSMDEKHASH